MLAQVDVVDHHQTKPVQHRGARQQQPVRRWR